MSEREETEESNTVNIVIQTSAEHSWRNLSVPEPVHTVGVGQGCRRESRSRNVDVNTGLQGHASESKDGREHRGPRSAPRGRTSAAS